MEKGDLAYLTFLQFRALFKTAVVLNVVLLHKVQQPTFNIPAVSSTLENVRETAAMLKAGLLSKQGLLVQEHLAHSTHLIYSSLSTFGMDIGNSMCLTILHVRAVFGEN